MSVQELSDEQLVELYQAGNREVFDTLVSRYETRLYSFGAKMCRHAEDAKDLLQDTFLNVFRYLDSFRGETKFKNWLYKIAATSCLKRQRRKKDQPDTELSWEDLLPGEHPDGHEHPAWLSTPIKQLIDKEMKSFILDSLHELPVKYREVFLLRDVEGFRTNEVADIMGISEGSVKTRLHRARIFLRNKINSHFGDS